MIIGLTGGIGSGKTTVANMFAKLGVELIDADIVARQIVAPGTKALKQITAHFGDHVIDDAGHLNRAVLRAIVFADNTEKEWLNKLLHPIIRQEILCQLTAAKGTYVILVAPLLIENNLVEYVDRVLIIDIDKQLQLQRTLKRDQSNKETIEAIIASQMSRKERLLVADDVIDNSNTDLVQIEQQVIQLHKKYLSKAEQQITS